MAGERAPPAQGVRERTQEACRDPFTGIGKPEPLRYHLPGG
ncbi:type II toxin-antitoxin system YoeB family toxin [Solihabitans fulvus]|nr:type II toxin-antitoxin system YoeB family toxin [Solihabitans fulvus]